MGIQYFEQEKIVDIACEEGVSHVAVLDRLKRIYRKLKNNLLICPLQFTSAVA